MSTDPADKRKKDLLHMGCVLYMTNLGVEFKVYENYSGRGMFGRHSSFAFTTPEHPQGAHGQKFIAMGFAFDNMAKEWIYYLV